MINRRFQCDNSRVSVCIVAFSISLRVSCVITIEVFRVARQYYGAQYSRLVAVCGRAVNVYYIAVPWALRFTEKIGVRFEFNRPLHVSRVEMTMCGDGVKATIAYPYVNPVYKYYVVSAALVLPDVPPVDSEDLTNDEVEAVVMFQRHGNAAKGFDVHSVEVNCDVRIKSGRGVKVMCFPSLILYDVSVGHMMILYFEQGHRRYFVRIVRYGNYDTVVVGINSNFKDC